MDFNHIIGQEKAKKMLTLLGHSFLKNGKLPPVGVFGSSGLGKTFLMTQFSEAIHANLIYINGSAVKDPLAFRKYFADAKQDQTRQHLVFIDECHLLPRKIQENMLSILEQPAILCTAATKDVGNVQTVDGMRWIEKGDVIREALPDNLSFVLATTDTGKMKDTMLNRLRKIHLEQYSLEEKTMIALQALGEADINTDEVLAKALAKRCRNIRNLKNDIIATYSDIATSNITSDVDSSLELLDEVMGIDADGASDRDNKYLRCLYENGTTGVDTLATYLHTDKLDIVNNMEPFLLEREWIVVSSKGRKLTQAGHQKVRDGQ